VLTVEVVRVATNTVFSIGGRPRAPHELAALLCRLSALSSNMQVNVRADATASAADMAQALYLIQKAGLHNVVLIVPGVLDGAAGYYELSIDCTGKPIGGCIADCFVESGFHALHDLELEDVTGDLDGAGRGEGGQDGAAKPGQEAPP
jgi:hypothetical protein